MRLKIYLILTLCVCAVKLQEILPVVNSSSPSPTPSNNSRRVDNRTQTVWVGQYENDRRGDLACWLLGGWNGNLKTTTIRSTEAELPGYDGWYNNLDKPDMGAIDGHLLRRWPAAYEDGTYEPSGSNRPNPLTLSQSLLAGPIGSKSRTGKSALLVFFGQQVVEEILDAQRPACPPEYFNIKIPDNHPYRATHSEMPLLRTRYDQRTGYSPNNPRQQLNEITPYIDGGLFYGTTKQWADRLRTYANGTVDPDGKLAYSHGGLFPEYNTERLPLANPPPPFHHSEWIQQHETAKVSRFFKLGNPRGNENTFLLTFGILWFRWHNYLAAQIRSEHRDWSSDKVFNEARKWVIATYQHIVVDEWIPTWLNQDSLPEYVKYDPSINPQIDQFFQAAAFRFGHTLVVPGVYLRDYSRNGCNTTIRNWNRAAVRTCNAFWRPQDAIKTVYDNATNELVDIDRVLMGMALQLCEEEDHKIVEDLRGNVFGPLEFPRRDLMAVNIQRGRDHGLPDFNTAREAYGLQRINSFDHFNASDEVRRNMSDLYEGDVNKIDPWVGGILETGDGPGELFKAVIKDQFARIRDGDRFWYENRKNKLFTPDEIARIKQLRLYDVIMAVTKMDYNDIQEEVFRVPTAQDQVPGCKLESSPCNFPGRPNMCYHLPQLNAAILNEDCKQGTTYDYFAKSPVSYILTFASIGAFIIGIVGLIYTLIIVREQQKKDQELKVSRKLQQSISKGMEALHLASEWRGPKTPSRGILIKCDKDKMQLQILSRKGCLLRALDLHTKNRSLDIFTTKDKNYIIIKTQNDHDLVLDFESDFLQDAFNNTLKMFLNEFQTPYTENQIPKLIPKEIETYDKRKAKLDMFFRVVFAQAFKISYSKEEILSVDRDFKEVAQFEITMYEKEEILSVDRDFKEVAQFEITMYEFADILGMHPEKEFIQRMFLLIDKDKNGFISFREFTDLLVIFAKGTELEKGKLLFDMSFLDTVGGTVDNQELEKAILDMMRSAGLQNKDKLDFQDFLALVGEDIKKLNKATLGFKGLENENKYLDTARQTIEDLYWDRDEINQRFQGKVNNYSKQIDDNQEKAVQKIVVTEISFITTALRYIENNSVYLFWKSLFTLVVIAIFAERAYHYSVEAEHGGLRRIAGYGVTVTRGAASAMMFTYSALLVTMCRNLWCFLRDTPFSRYLPLDSMVEFHKYIAYLALIATVIHIIGHAFNFYHISTQTADDLICLFRNYFRSTHEIPKFHYWAWGTITGFTGIMLTLIMTIMYLFAQSVVRKRLYNWFWYTHSLYPVFFIFMVLHGAGRLVQEPFFHYFFLGPVILFVLDTLVSVRRKKIQIPVINAKIWPSDVTMLEFIKPSSFIYKSGQWVRIACLGLSTSEYHPFTISSSPDEPTLTVHIRAVGPWTKHIRKIYDEASPQARPQLYLDGPYGESHQDWYQFDVSILVGGGIGVTPFASILKDIVFKSNINYKFKCQKVYFIWVSKTQRQFEWMVDIISNLEDNDKNGIVSAHIFITQFYKKFDLRTILLYICERHYQKLSQKSLFTNLKAVTHFGRPSFPEFFKTVQSLHSGAAQIGVFSCGPPPMTNSVETACFKINRTSASGPLFVHHSKNF
ncbi:Ferric reductase like transmembrane component [Popillia japonica]|uniref:NAD(P)H oxidase (H2O2-forming) n=1 Tax=Popillia japonica TaxID=7064 RepID=A0AAW1IZE5_POPJA